MQDILSLDDDRVLNHVFQYSRPDEVRRFPLHVWLRLKGSCWSSERGAVFTPAQRDGRGQELA
jgi:hypothetical protein